MEKMNTLIDEAVDWIQNSKHIIAFTGAGISAESGIPPFRGEEGLWNRYDPVTLEIDYFLNYPEKSWEVIREIFYEHFNKALPNKAHDFLSDLERNNKLKAVITQNIDNLHQKAGSKEVYEFHGNSSRLVCLSCNHRTPVSDALIKSSCPRCQCGGIYKPDFVFFGEPIPSDAYQSSVNASSHCDLMMIIGTSGEVMPANQMPLIAHANHAKIIEINKEASLYTTRINTLFIQGSASAILSEIENRLNYSSR